MYQTKIATLLAAFGLNADPRHIEAFLRDEHGTLDSIPALDFQSAVKEVAGFVAEDVDFAEKLAQSYGL